MLVVARASLAADSDLDPASPEVLQFVRDAQSVYIFPFKPHSELRVDTSRLRLLSRDARDSLVGIIADPAHWEQGFLTYVVPEDLPPDIGIYCSAAAQMSLRYFAARRGGLMRHSVASAVGPILPKRQRSSSRNGSNSMRQKS
jgi:hypothetical protein